ncbi:hypothetical protein WJX72_003447 [[Myrmecia] bisecta]|uniref:Uncharacterized protein n=1 Tax=[Myrmecia] bisecta TaxID=41462 RepID=A0AAW1R4W1_9CHLO
MKVNLQLQRRCQDKRANPETPRTGVGLKAVWYAAEQFGNVVGLKKARQAKSVTGVQQDKMSREQVIASLRDDYQKDYFISGVGEMSAYEDDCLFADPFAGFRGVERFKKNVANLGSLLEDTQLDILEWQEREGEVQTKWRFSAILGLPWKPRLAAAGRTTHVFSKETGKVVKHLEEWDSEPGRVLRLLLKPTSRMPTNQWEVFFSAVDDGDVMGVWFALSGLVLKWSLPVVGVSLICKAFTGEGLPGVFLGSVEGLAYLGVAAGAGTQLWKLVKGMSGGEAG